MLDKEQRMEGINTIKDAIISITGNYPTDYIKRNLTVTAEVNGETIIDSKPIETELMIKHNNAQINIYWENSGYKLYKNLGLFGSMNTDWQIVTSFGERTFQVQDEDGSYLLTIEY